MARRPPPRVAVVLLVALAAALLADAENVAALTALPAWNVTIGELVRLANGTCTRGAALSCNACAMTVNFEFTTDRWGHQSWNCTRQYAGIRGRCVTCLPEDRSTARLLNIDGPARCEQLVANALIKRSMSSFLLISDLKRADCDDRTLNSRYNLALAAAVVRVFTTPVAKRDLGDMCRSDIDCRDSLVCATGMCGRGGGSSAAASEQPVWRTLLIAIAVGAAVTAVVLACIAYFACWRRKNDAEDYESWKDLSESEMGHVPPPDKSGDMIRSADIEPRLGKMASGSATTRQFCMIPSQNSAFSRIESFTTD